MHTVAVFHSQCAMFRSDINILFFSSLSILSDSTSVIFSTFPYVDFLLGIVSPPDLVCDTTRILWL